MRNGWTDHDVSNRCRGTLDRADLHDSVGQDHDVCQHHAVVCLDVRGQLVGKGVATRRENVPRPRALEEAAQAYKSAECRAMVEAVREAEAARRGEGVKE